MKQSITLSTFSLILIAVLAQTLDEQQKEFLDLQAAYNQEYRSYLGSALKIQSKLQGWLEKVPSNMELVYANISARDEEIKQNGAAYVTCIDLYHDKILFDAESYRKLGEDTIIKGLEDWNKTSNEFRNSEETVFQSTVDIVHAIYNCGRPNKHADCQAVTEKAFNQVPYASIFNDGMERISAAAAKLQSIAMKTYNDLVIVTDNGWKSLDENYNRIIKCATEGF